MWSNLIKTFERSLVLNTHYIFAKRIALRTPFNYDSLHQRSLVYSAILHNTEIVRAEPSGVSEQDVEYIIPYEIKYEKLHNAEKLKEALRTQFNLNETDVEHIVNDNVVWRNLRYKSLMDTLNVLHKEGIPEKLFVEYPWLITLDASKLLGKLKILKTLHNVNNINDFVPLLGLQMPRLRKLVYFLNGECQYLDNDNRVNYIAKKLDVPPSTVTKYLSKRLFILEMPLEMFKANLQNMINYNVEPMSILKDLWGFRYAPSAVEKRLKRALHAKKNKIMPWMVRCPEPILQKSLQISLDEKKILGDKTSVAEYVGERLGFTAKEAQAIMNKHPQVNTVRVTKIKEVLDYLLNEAQFTRYEIAQVPRILCHSLETTKKRLEELKQYGCRPTSLIIVCRSKREYNKFLNQCRKPHDCKEIVEQEVVKEEKVS